MANKKQSKSRLSETNFSVHNLRDAYISKQAEYVRAIRDEALFSNWGISVLVRVPVYPSGELAINNVDEYSNFVNVEWKDTVETVIPKFTDYHEHVSDEGQQVDGIDGIYPLEILIPSKLYLPRDSRIILNEYDANENQIAREWQVLSTSIKQLSGSKTYTQIANCVPARKETFNNVDTIYSGSIWFDYGKNITLEKQLLKAQGIIWFLREGIDETKIRKGLPNEIYEDLPDITEYYEKTDLEQVYLDNADQIINSGTKFTVGQILNVIDDENNVIEIETGINETVLLKARVNKVNENGGIEEFTLNVTKGYTVFENETTAYISSKNGENAEIKLISTVISDAAYQETLDATTIPGPKYVIPSKPVFAISAKRIALSVLN